jgi:hypothetical protein
MIFLFVLAVALACHPQSRWMCDDPCGNWSCTDPVCTVLCEPICNTTCICYSDSLNASYPLRCRERCAPDQCESDSCPACETYCPTRCDAGYDPLCEATSCHWRCRADPGCPHPYCEQQDPDAHCDPPHCELMSERPACEYNSGGRKSVF